MLLAAVDNVFDGGRLSIDCSLGKGLLSSFLMEWKNI